MQFKEIILQYQDDINKVNQIIAANSQGNAKLVEEITKYVALSGGKRIRPLLTIICTKLINKNATNYHELCAAIEMIHTATLLHDDVIDESNLRRGKETANAIWGDKLPILVGDFLFSLAFMLSIKTESLKILSRLSKTINDMADGELNQLENSKNLSLTIEKYYEIIHSKTSSLFRNATIFGAYLNDADKKYEDALDQYGNNLGLLFQIIDDIIDYTSDSKELGKSSGDDYFEGKITLPAILAYQKSDDQDKAVIANLFTKSINGQSTDDDFKQIMQILNHHNAFEESYKIAQNHYDKAIESLEIFEDCLEKQQLIEIANFALNRTK